MHTTRQVTDCLSFNHRKIFLNFLKISFCCAVQELQCIVVFWIACNAGVFRRRASARISAAILDSQNLRELGKGGGREKTPTRKGCENGHGSKTAGYAQKEPCLFSPFDFQNGG